VIKNVVKGLSWNITIYKCNSCDPKLNFQHHYSSLHVTWSFRNHFNADLLLKRLSFNVKNSCLIFLWKLPYIFCRIIWWIETTFIWNRNLLELYKCILCHYWCNSMHHSWIYIYIYIYIMCVYFLNQILLTPNFWMLAYDITILLLKAYDYLTNMKTKTIIFMFTLKQIY